MEYHRKTELIICKGTLKSTCCESQSQIEYQHIKKQLSCYRREKKRIKWINCPPVGGPNHITMEEESQVIFVIVIKVLEQKS